MRKTRSLVNRKIYDCWFSLGSGQSAQIISGMACAIVSLTDEVTATSVTKFHKVSRQILVRGGFVFY
jgi:hypothetical protein